MSNKWVYIFSQDQTDGRTHMKDLLGGKGANLAEMTHLGLPVPPGFTITTEACTHYFKNGSAYPAELEAQLQEALTCVEREVDAGFGDEENPLLVSVRSGARVSMPGMMDTVLNLGLNDKTVEGLAKKSGNPRFAYDSYRRFIQMYSNVVLEMDHHDFESILEMKKEDKDVQRDVDLTAEDLQELLSEYKSLVLERTGKDFPQNPQDQLWGAINAVFDSWMNDRAKVYRRINNISDDWGTAVNVQAMVFGNMGESSATGVAFTRNPSNGEDEFYGEYLINAQGEDVVAGIRTPQNITKAARVAAGSDLPSMEEVMPEVFTQLDQVRVNLEKHYKDMQDIEFTVQNSKLWLLQTRGGKRTAAAAVKIAIDMCEEGILTKEEAILRVDPKMLDQLLHPSLDANAQKTLLTRGLPASPGAASGIVAFTAEQVEIDTQHGRDTILVRVETSPEDITGMHLAKGILTARGGMTSHAAVVARGMGRPCVSGAGELKIDTNNKVMKIGSHTIKEGDLLTIDGGTGEVMLGEVATVEPDLSGDFSQLMAWADDVRRMKIRTNAETKKDAEAAVRFGAEGIGLCRTEHMFFEGDRIISMREMILASDEEGRRAALAKLLPMQRGDFEGLFKVMRGLPVTVRLLDPPLHEFLPHNESEMIEVATQANISLDLVKERCHALEESNPMLGHRGCRLGISYPEIYEMQVQAVLEAAYNVEKSTGDKVVPEIMIPLVGDKRELEYLKNVVVQTADQLKDDKGVDVEYMVGTMIEVPRAALKAEEIANSAEFFSFGTNDLTQTTFGFSRDDSTTFLKKYEEENIHLQDPFMTLDQSGVGQLVEMACEKGRSVRSSIKLGVCGEHGGDPASIEFFEGVGLDYVSCSPYRVPIARLAAAQATLRRSKKNSSVAKVA